MNGKSNRPTEFCGHSQKLLTDAGWNLPDKFGDDKPQGPAWFEAGDIDHEGNSRGWKLAQHLNRMLREIVDRIENLLASGFMTIHVVTDHGWLLMPGGLPKVAVEGEAAGHFLDLRTQPGNPSSSVTMGSKPFKEDGTSSVVVENEDMEGREAMLVVVDSGGRLIAQSPVVIGKE